MSENVTERLPAIALRESCILPGRIAYFDLSRPSSLLAVSTAMQSGQRMFAVMQSDAKKDEPGFGDLHEIGCVIHIRQMTQLAEDKGMRVLCEGIGRAKLLAADIKDGYLSADLHTYTKEEEEGEGGPLQEAEAEAFLRELKETFHSFVVESGNVGREVASGLLDLTDPLQMIDEISIKANLPAEEMQSLLEQITYRERFERLLSILANEIDVIRYRKDIQGKIRESIDKSQREYMLREQLQLIRKELGEDTTVSDIDMFKITCSRLKAKRDIKDKILKEIHRFENIPAQSPESQVLRGYIETLLALPWDKASRDSKDLKKAREILDRDHYGLDKVKERILEFLAVRQLTKKGQSPILCLVGPPGTGKTSIGKSVAEALNKKYGRLSLGGVHDEAEIRGHRRTYVGAMPGRIVQALKQAEVKNPLIVLDEIDKLSADYKGDTSSAMLEVLDSEQNSHFADHYVELPVDLSEVLFIATANDMNTIPGPLLDRMEVIEISSYTEHEKMHIAREHLLPKQIRANGLTDKILTVDDQAIGDIISRYSQESGVRTLERMLGEVCRKTALKILEEHVESVHVTRENLRDFLGNPKFDDFPANTTAEVGIVRGLAWTAVGGVTLQVEVNVMPGKGDFVLTGQLGDVMKESATAGISWIRANAAEYSIADDFFEHHDIHIHIPEGAVPKDGPSAGITMATAVISAVTGRAVRADIAMTGEITLRGRVLPIGGLKEKLLAALRAGIKEVLLPVKNTVDVGEIPKEITDQLKIVFVEDMKKVLEESLV